MKSSHSAVLLFSFLLLLVAVTVDAQTYHASGVRKGIYISPWDDGIGSVDYTTLDGGIYYFFLGDTAKENSLLDWLEDWGFNAISIYNLRTIFDNSGRRANLRSFMARARTRGITNIEAVMGSKNSHYDQIKTHNDVQATSDDEKFDGIVTEVEYWHSDTVNKLSDPLTYGRGIGLTGRAGKTFYYCCYLGWIPLADLTTLEPLMDYMWPHSYSDSLHNLYSRTKDRMNTLAGLTPTNGQVKVTPIFAATGVNYKPATEHFSGDIIEDTKSLDLIPTTYEEFWNNDTAAPVPPISSLTGFQWYQYSFLRLHLGDYPTPAPPTPAPPSPVPASPPTPVPNPAGTPASSTVTTTTTASAASPPGGTPNPSSSSATTLSSNSPTSAVTSTIGNSNPTTTTTPPPVGGAGPTTAVVTTNTIEAASGSSVSPPSPTTTAAATQEVEGGNNNVAIRGIYAEEGESGCTTVCMIGVVLGIGLLFHGVLLLAYVFCIKSSSIKDSTNDATTKKEPEVVGSNGSAYSTSEGPSENEV